MAVEVLLQIDFDDVSDLNGGEMTWRDDNETGAEGRGVGAHFALSVADLF